MSRTTPQAMFSYIYLLFLLKNLVFVLAQNDIDIAAVHLLWQGNCTSDQKIMIKGGWDDAMTIVDNIKGSIDFNNGAAELEFLGPKQYINSYTNNIVTILNQAATWKLGWWSAWYVYANCQDWKNSCRRNTLAYTNNVDFKTGLIEQPNDPSSTVKITFCPDYFGKARLSKVIANGKARSVGNSDKWNLYKYANKGSVVLHELMHGDAVAYAANGNRHITDMQIQMRPLDGSADWKWNKIYGPLFTRVLARLDDKQLGSYITRNADSLAQFALAKYVSGQIAGYPYLPLVTWEATGVARQPWGTLFTIGTNGIAYVNTTTEATLDVEAGIDTVDISDTMLDCTESDDGDCTTLNTVTLTSLIDDSEYPVDYITQRNAWIATYNAQDGDPTAPNEDTDDFEYSDPSLECNSDKAYQTGTGSVDITTAEDAISQTCTEWVADNTTLNMQDYCVSSSSPIPNSQNSLWLAGLWNRGEPLCQSSSRTFLAFECAAMLEAVINSCDNSSATVPRYGGSKTFDCIVWSIDITAGPPPGF